jgi:hypothetical protein
MKASMICVYLEFFWLKGMCLFLLFLSVPFVILEAPCHAADLFGNQPQLGNDNLLRQSSLPADWLAALQGSIDDTDPSSQMPSMTSPDESLSGRTSEDTAGVGVSGKSSIYSRDDSLLVIDTTSGGLWHSPTSPGTE